MTGTELVGPLPTITFIGGCAPLDYASQTRIAYQSPRDTCDPRSVACTEHHPACDCREACFAEDRQEERGRWNDLHRTAWRALAGHQAEYPMDLNGAERHLYDLLCLCSGCVIYREGFHDLLPFRAVDWATGRVRPVPAGRR